MKRKSDEMSPLGQKDTYRRSEMEFGVAADAYRSDPAKKATRNGAVMVTVAFSIAAFATVLATSVAICGELTLVGILVSAIVALAMLSSVHVCMDWERAVVMRLGKFNRLAGPGLFFTIPLLEFCTLRVDQRMNVTPFGAEEALTSDLVPLDVDAVLFWVIWDPEKACTEVEDCYFAVALSAQTALRDAIGRASLQNVVMRRHQLDQELRDAVEKKVSDWAFPLFRSRCETLSSPRNCRALCLLRRKPSAARALASRLWKPKRTSRRFSTM